MLGVTIWTWGNEGHYGCGRSVFKEKKRAETIIISLRCGIDGLSLGYAFALLKC